MDETDEEKRKGMKMSGQMEERTDRSRDGRTWVGGCSHMCKRPPRTLSPTPNRLPAISFRRGVGGLWGQVHSFPSHSGLQGSPRTPVPQYFQRHLS